MSGLLSQADKDAAADLLTDAFFDNPAHVYIFPNSQMRREGLRWLMRANLNRQLDVGMSFGRRAPEGAIEVMAFWHPPGAPKAGPAAIIRYGFLAMPLRFGLPAFRRMLFTVKTIEERRARALGDQESWYLNNMVVASAVRGTGLGSQALRTALAEYVEPSGAPASLTTQKAENVRFYKGLGFHVADDRRIVDRTGVGFDNWVMVYNA